MRLARGQRLTGIGRHNCGARLLIHEIPFKRRFLGVFGCQKWGGILGSVHIRGHGRRVRRALGIISGTDRTPGIGTRQGQRPLDRAEVSRLRPAHPDDVERSWRGPWGPTRAGVLTMRPMVSPDWGVQRLSGDTLMCRCCSRISPCTPGRAGATRRSPRTICRPPWRTPRGSPRRSSLARRSRGPRPPPRPRRDSPPRRRARER